MNKLAVLVTTHKRIVVSLFVLMALFGTLLIGLTEVNYDMVQYHPQDAPSTQAIAIMEEEFGNNNPNARIMLEGLQFRKPRHQTTNCCPPPGLRCHLAR